MVQGGASRRERTQGNNKWNEGEGELKRSWSRVVTHVPTCTTLGITMPRAPYANSHWASWLSKVGLRRVPDAGE
jgi:hypothetical protein